MAYAQLPEPDYKNAIADRAGNRASIAVEAGFANVTPNEPKDILRPPLPEGN
jgi:hypothetical protein